MKEVYNGPDNLIADINPIVIKSGITLKKGQGILKRGTVLGEVKASKLMVKTDKSVTDGSEIASVVLAETVNTDKTSDVAAVAFKAGCFFSSELIFGGTSKMDDHKSQLRDVNIYTK